MQWLQDQNQSNVDNLNNVRCEASRHFRGKIYIYIYLNAKINELLTSSKIKKKVTLLYGGIMIFEWLPA